MPPDIEAIAEQVFVALADPSRRAILAALASGGPATATDLAGRLPITRQAIAKHLALLTEAGLVTAEPGERRRVRYRLRSTPMQVAQQFLAALARDWDGPLDALKDHLGGTGTTNTPTSHRRGDLSISPRPPRRGRLAEAADTSDRGHRLNGPNSARTPSSRTGRRLVNRPSASEAASEITAASELGEASVTPWVSVMKGA
jgi:DNA-binding transcriptional ArsR family regulator